MELLPELHNFITIYCADCGESRVIMQVCRDRFCPHCGHVRRWRSRERLLQVMKSYRRRPRYMLKMLTVSMANCEDLEKGISELIAGFRRLRQTKFWKKHVIGGLFVIEITGKPGSWHPHIHAFIYSLRIPWQGIRDAWHRSSGGGTATWIANISNNNAVYYVTKYVTKSSLEESSRPFAYEALRGKRLFQRFGTFAGIDISLPMFARKCDKCESELWINEYDIKRISKQIAPRFSREPQRIIS